MAFDFPPAQDGLRVTNPESGVTYVYRDKYSSWIIEAVDNKAVRIHTLCWEPCDPNQGDIWYDPCTNCAHVYYDGAWLPIVDCTTQSEAVTYKGEVESYEQLPGRGNELGDLWVVLDESALYMWTSTGWLAVDSHDDEELRVLIQKEESARIEADLQLAQLIKAEAHKRETEDDKLWSALEDETEARKSGDQAITDLLEDCCTRAQDGLQELTEGLQEEAQAREDADKELQRQVDELGADISDVSDRLDGEIQDRIDGDDELQKNLDEEILKREAADDQLLQLVHDKGGKWMGEVPTADDLPDTRYVWRPITVFNGETIYSMSWGPDRFIAGSSDGHAWSSDDGMFWERRNVGVPYNGRVTATLYASGVWLIGGDKGLVSRSVDGRVWSNVYSTTTSGIQDFAFGGGTFIYVTDGGVVATSSDGETWTKQDQTVRWGVHGIDSILTVTYNEELGRFVAGTQRGMILISDTGVGWDLIDPRLGGGGKILTIVSTVQTGKEKLVAAGDFPERLLYSEDSINWVKAPRHNFEEGYATDLKDCGTHLVASLSNGKSAFAFNGQVRTWTVEAVGANDRLLAIAYAPKNSNVPHVEGIYATAGNFGQAFVRVPGEGLEPGDTWIVLDELCLYTWSTNGWVTSCGEGGGGGVDGIRRLIAGDHIKLNPASGAGAAVQISIEGGMANLNDLNELNQKLEKEIAYRIQGDQEIVDDFTEDQKRQDKANLAADALLEAQILALANKTDKEQAEQDKKIEELGSDISELNDSIFGSCEYEDKAGTLAEYDGRGGIQYSTTGKKIYLNQYAKEGWPEPSDETEITINGDVYEVVGVGVASGYNYFYELKVGIGELLDTEVTVSYCSPQAAFVTPEQLEEDQERQDAEIEAIKDGLDFCKLDGDFVVRNQIEFTSTVVFDSNAIVMPVNIELEVGDKLDCVSPDGDEESYTIRGVSEVIPPHSDPYVTESRRYTFNELVTVPWIQKGAVHISSCVYPYVTPEEFAEDQQRQDEEIEKRVLKAGDTITGDLIVEADVHANRVETLNVDSGEDSNLLLKHNGNTKVYVGRTEVTVQNPLKLNTEGVDPEHVVTKGYIDALDAKQAAEINTIEYKLDALLGLTFQGTYEFKHDQTCEEAYQECLANCTNDARCEQDCARDYSTCEQNSVDPGFFEAIDPDGQFDHLQEIIISKNDKSGIEIDWSGVLQEGDYLEVDHVFAAQLDKTNYGLYRITEEPVEKTNSKGEKTYDIKLEFLQGDGVLNPQELYEIRGITAAQGVNPEELADFLLKNDAAALYAPKSHTHNYASSSHTHSGYAASNHSHSYVSAGDTNKYMTHKGGAGACEFYISGNNLYWRA